MHFIKNICKSLFGLLLNTKGNTKDGIKVRKDMVEMAIRLELAPAEKDRSRIFLPPMCYALSKEEKLSLLECLKSIKVPLGYSSIFLRRYRCKK
jgi:hypothetical protein